MSEARVLWTPNSAVQHAFLRCSARTAMIGGGAGGGKTSALLAAAALQSGNPKHRAVIFRRDYPSLKHIISASYALLLPLRASYNKSEHAWTFSSGATIEFSHLEDETAVYQHAGKEYSFLGFDELTQLPGDATDSRGQPINSAFSFMQSRLRAAKDSGLRLEVRCTATPGGPGMAWVKSYFRVPDSGESAEFVDEVTGFRRAYFKSTVEDNPALSETDYHRQLLDLPEAQKKALLHGDWSAYVGQVFSEYSYARHTCEAFPVHSFRKWRACDDGYAAPACVLWFAQDKTFDRLYCYQELYVSGMTPERMAECVLSFDFGEKLSGVIDSAAFSNYGMAGVSRADAMNKLGCKWQPVEKAAGSRIPGLSAIHARLSLQSDGKPGLVVFRNCRNLIRTLPTLVYSTRNPEDTDESCEDHAVDALRYGLQYRKLDGRMVPCYGL